MDLDRETIWENIKIIFERLRVVLVPLLIFSLIGMICLLILNQIYNWVQIENQTVLASAMGAIGTLLLAYLTFRTIQQNKKLVKQQREQVENQRAQSRPRLRQISDFEPVGNNDQLSFELENFGRGTAFNIKFRTDILIPLLGINTALHSDYYDTEYDSMIPPLSSVERSIYKDDVQVTSPGATGGVLQPGSSGEFTHRVDFKNEQVSDEDVFLGETDSDLPRIIVFSSLLEVLKEENIPEIYTQFTLSYTDTYGKHYEEEFPVRRASISDLNDVSDLTNSAIWMRPSTDGLESESLQNVDDL